MTLKTILTSGLGLIVLPFSLSVFAASQLDTINNTDHDSSVMITSSAKHLCSSSVPHFGTYTPAHNSSHVSALGVRTICMNLTGKGTCTADVYMTRDCTGPVVATAALDLSSITITSINPVPNSGYSLSGAGTSSMTINPA